MSDFKSYIKQKYQAEVNPQFTEQAWEKFAAVSGLVEEKKKRKIIPFLFFGAIALGLVFFIYLSAISQGTSNSLKNNYKEYPINDSKEAIARTNESKVENVDRIKNNFQPAIENNKNFTTKTTTKTTSNATDLKSSKIVLDPSKSTYNNIPNIEESVNNKAIASIEVQDADVPMDNVDLIKEQRPQLSFQSLTSFLPLLKNNITFPLSSQNVIIPIHRIIDSPWSIKLLAGGGQQFHRSIKDQKLWLTSAELNYKLLAHMKIKSIIGFTRSSYYSKVLNKNLGLRSINYPDREARFSQVQSTASYFEAGLGIDLLTGTYKGFSAQVGPAILLVKELERTLAYDFISGSEDVRDVRNTATSMGIQSYYMVVNAGLNYELNPQFSLLLQGEYFFTPSANENHLQDQLRFKTGISKKF